MIRLVTNQDLNAWMELAGEVEPLFGEMVGNEDFISGIKGCIATQSAFCVVNTDNEVEGIIAINKALNEIAWLAVRERCRGQGYGYQLLEKAIDSLDNRKPIYVQTFSPGVKAGEAARKIYLKFGFRDYKDGGKNPAGIDTVIMKCEPLRVC
jgi:GNAT superfamily N-acetyltransferase